MPQNEPKLGTLLTGDEKRDAIHIAIMPVCAGMGLSPGAFVTVRDNEAFACDEATAVGIIDPFLAAPVAKGQRVYMLLKPYTITSLRHEWTHPLIEAPPAAAVAANSREVSMKWLEDRFGGEAHDIIEAARAQWGDAIVLGFETPSELWDNDTRELALGHLSIIIGREIPSDTRFKCTC